CRNAGVDFFCGGSERCLVFSNFARVSEVGKVYLFQSKSDPARPQVMQMRLHLPEVRPDGGEMTHSRADGIRRHVPHMQPHVPGVRPDVRQVQPDVRQMRLRSGLSPLGCFR
ncbi:MAG: hypothetical protein WB974_16565, partial [Acidobacteriaceae bacterium]